MFCAAIPAVAAAGARLNNQQVQRRREAEVAAEEKQAGKPILKLTSAVIALLLVGSVTYHTLSIGPRV